MPAKVIDASALAALVFAEPDADSIDREIVGSSLVAPVLLYFELANVCLHKMSRYPDKRDSLLEGFELAHKMGISQLEVDEDRATEGLCRAIAQCGRCWRNIFRRGRATTRTNYAMISSRGAKLAHDHQDDQSQRDAVVGEGTKCVGPDEG